jgi:uncharacterized membrane protein
LTFHDLMIVAVRCFEAAGALTLSVGAIWSAARAAGRWRARDPRAFPGLRQDLGRVILLGLEILIIADVILTVAVEQTLESALTLGIIVLVRTVLSVSIEVELDGTWPWRKRGSSGTTAADVPTTPGGVTAPSGDQAA